MNYLFEQIKTWWDSASTSTRIVGVGLVAVLVLSIAVATILASSPNYQDLFTDLSPDDAASITQKLDEEHVKYELVDGDKTVRVPAQDKDRVRMEMIRAGLPSKASSLMGSEWLSKIGIGTTAEEQKQYIRMAQEGELSKTIGSLSEVQSASIHISDSNDAPFAVDNVPSSASVVVNLKPNAQLSDDEVAGIANLVAKSVKGLDLKNVVVSDGTGAMLWDGSEAHGRGAGGGSNNKIAQEHAYSEQKRQELQKYLDEVLGPQKSLVTVNAELNFDQVHTQDTINSKGAPVNTTESDEKYTGAGVKTPGGVSGTSANTPGGSANTYRADTGNTGSGTYDKTDETSTMAPSIQNRDVTQSQGGVNRMAVSVLLDSSIPQATKDSITSYLTNYVGASTADSIRTVSVQSLPFSTALATATMAQQASIVAENQRSLFIKLAIVVIIVGLLIFFYTRSTKEARVQQELRIKALEATESRAMLGDSSGLGTVEALLNEPPLSIDDLLGEMPEAKSRRGGGFAAPEIEEQQDLKLESIREMIQSHPDSVALLLKGWMSSDGSNVT
jgi:flagellar M-ring protein FliF